MKTQIYITIIALFCLLPIASPAQFTETKTIHKQFGVTPETQIEISNKYGKIELNTWEKDSVIIDIEIKIEERKLSKLEKTLDEIDFDFTKSQHYLIARTKVGSGRSGFEKELLKFKETLLQIDGNIEINYSVWLPATNDLKVENKFGDIFIGDYKGDAEIDLSNGNLKSHNFEGNTDLVLNFSDATINYLKHGRLECNFSDIYIKKAQSAKIKSKSTVFEILEIGELDATSRRDKFRIQRAERVEANGSFSNFRLNELIDRLTLRADYGDIDVEKTATDFSNIFIESKSTDINLYFNKESNFGFEITHVKTELDFCREISIENEENIDDKKQKVSGSFGKNAAQNRLQINSDSGEINIFTD